ncbi:ras GEF [Trametes sanguinea]|nr:ras GEF [Trametes sanguinea]
MSSTQSNDSNDVLDPVTPPSASLPPPPTPTSPPTALPRPEISPSDQHVVFVLSDDAQGVWSEPLPADIAHADLFVPPDGRFVETSSGPAARELKRRYDRAFGVGIDVRSPFVITAFVNQHGKQMYRLGTRDLTAPAAAAQDVLERTAQSSATSSSIHNHHTPHTSPTSGGSNMIHSKRRGSSRMSVHSLLPSSVFRSGVGPAVVPNTVFDASRSPPSRRLRKTRSIPNGMTVAEGATAQSAVPPTGRPHAHSVSSADAFAAPAPLMTTNLPPTHTHTSDFFADAMAWSPQPTSPYGSSSSSAPFRFQPPSPTTPSKATREIAHPFGVGVTFDSPSWRSSSHLTSPPTIREMQSFESGLTARAEYLPRMSRMSKLSLTGASSSNSEEDLRRDTPSPSGSSPVPPIKISEPTTPTAVNLAPTTLPSRYSTALFDVLQTYRGLPSLDKIDSTLNEMTVRFSLRADESAAPRDDPRFVIWGGVDPERDPYDETPSSATDMSSHPNSSTSRRRMTKDRHQLSEAASFDSKGTGASKESERVLVAATIERWIAQLTSELNYDELLIFFLTYRTYVSAVDLGHLLICRFHWALGEATSSRDEMVRRIVRVRTFTAIRYWLLTFFDVDFVPNRELRLLFADWLNSLRRDPILQRHRDALKIVRQLRKVILDCKDAHIRKLNRASRKSTDKRRSAEPQFAAFADHGLPRPSVDSQARSFNDPEDFDIDFDFDGGVTPSRSGDFSLASADGSPTNALDLVMMRQPLHMAVLQYQTGKQNPTMHATGAGAAAVAQASHPNAALSPFPHNTISRVFVNTIGRLGRWKRVMNQRAPIQPPLTAGMDVSAFDVEANETGDLLMIKGGVEQYLRMVESQMKDGMARPSMVSTTSTVASATPTAVGVSSPPPSAPPSLPQSPRSPQSVLRQPAASLGMPAHPPQEEDVPPGVGEEAAKEVNELPPPPSYEESETEPRASTSSYVSEDTASLQTAATAEAMLPKNQQLDIVSIDDLDLSDLSSDEHLEIAAPPGLGLKKPARRLPTRRDFEFVRQSIDSVSSMGIRTRESMFSQDTSSIISSSSEVVSNGGGADMGGPIQAWHINAILDSLSDDEESGDVEAALRRLEGQINQDKQRAKQSKVDQWIQSIQQRGPGARFARRESMGDDEEAEADASGSDEDYGQVERRRFSGASAIDMSLSAGLSATSPQLSSRSSFASISQSPSASASASASVSQSASASASAPSASSEQLGPLALDDLRTPPAQGDANFGELVATPAVADAKPHLEDVVPIEILQSRVPSRPSTSAGSPSKDALTPQPSAGLPPPPGMPTLLRRHHSFILNYRSETLVQHLSMIDRELFLNISFEELITSHAIGSAEDANVLDWAQFLRERARLKAEGRAGPKTSALTAVRGRFNLLANFVTSEIVLTHPSERAMVINKFIRLAWKAYCIKNFNALVAIIAGLRSEWVDKAKRQAFNKVGAWENRMLRDLTAWTSPAGDFKLIRQTVDALAEAKSMPVGPQDATSKAMDGQGTTGRSRAASDSVYLSQIRHYSNLPDLIDPTSPHEPVGIDPLTNSFEAPAHPEVFSTLAPLPPSMQLEPLINVHKQRLISGVVKSLVAGQHLASKVQYPLDKKIFQKVLKLRGLDADTLDRALALYADKK